SFAAAREAWERDAGVVSREPVLRYLMAVGQAILDDRAAAIATLEALDRDADVPVATMLLAKLLLDVDPERGLAVPPEFAPPADPSPPYSGATALRRLGRLDEARAEVARGLERHPQDPGLLALASRIAMAQGDTARAVALAEESLERAPGDTLGLLARAEAA